MRVAPSEAACATGSSPLGLVAVGPMPAIDPASVTVDVDAGRATLRGHHLRGMVLRWTGGGQSGEDACTAPDTVGSTESCAFSVGRALPADPSLIQLAALPAGSRNTGDGALYDASARRLGTDDLSLRVASLTVAQLMGADVSVDVSSGSGRLVLVHPEAVGSVDCTDAVCDLDGHDLVVRGEHGGDDTLDVHLHLRPHVYVQHGGAPDANPLVAVPLQRCPVAIASAAPLRGATDQQVVVRVGARCAHDTAYEFSTSTGSTPLERTVLDGGDLYAVLRVARADVDELAVVVHRGSSVVGVARARTRRLPPLHAVLELPGHGPVDFVPTNREARVRVPSIGDDAVLLPTPVEGVYDVRRDEAGAVFVRGVDGAHGSVALRLGYRDRTLPAALRDLDLAEITEPVDRVLRAANLPAALIPPDGQPGEAIAEILCDDAAGHPTRLTPGTTSSVAYRARDTCRLVLHRERLRPEDGAQALRVTVSVTAPDGTARTDARLDQRVVLRPSPTPLSVFLSGAESPFDRLLVQVALSDDGDHYAVPADEHLAAPRAQWSVVMGTARARIYATTAIPTGLFRLADTGHSGILTLNAGALVRAVWLTREGAESPIGLEAGVMWLGIAGDTDPGASSRGAVAAVAGFGISVPIANASRATQTSINLHAWFEYEVSRSVLGQAGSPLGVVFGPSISIGDVGTSF